MPLDEQDHVAAARLGYDADPADWSSRPVNVAGAALLAAVDAFTGPAATASTQKLDIEGDGLTISVAPYGGTGILGAGPHVSLLVESADDAVEHVYEPDEAEAVGWRMIAAAHLARKARD